MKIKLLTALFFMSSCTFGNTISDNAAEQAFIYAYPMVQAEVIPVDSDLVKLMGRIMAQNQKDEALAQNYMDQWNIISAKNEAIKKIIDSIQSFL